MTSWQTCWPACAVYTPGILRPPKADPRQRLRVNGEHACTASFLCEFNTVSKSEGNGVVCNVLPAICSLLHK